MTTPDRGGAGGWVQDLPPAHGGGPVSSEMAAVWIGNSGLTSLARRSNEATQGAMRALSRVGHGR